MIEKIVKEIGVDAVRVFPQNHGNLMKPTVFRCAYGEIRISVQSVCGLRTGSKPNEIR